MKEFVESLEKDITKLKSLLLKNEKYPIEDIDKVYEKIRNKSNKQRPLEDGDWCQVHSGDREPFYAKIKKIHKDGMVVLYGIYGYREDLTKYEIAFPLDIMLPIDDEIGRMLEYANRNNTVMSMGDMVYG